MDSVKIIEIKKSVFEDNNLDADALRKELKLKGVFLLPCGCNGGRYRF